MTFRSLSVTAAGAALLGAAATFAAAATPAPKPRSASPAIESQKIAEGVWAAPTPGGANVGWFLVGDVVVAVDSGATPEVGRALVAEIQKTAGRKPRYLVVTHAHRDHAGGVPAFAAAGAQVLSAERAASGLVALLREGAGGKKGTARGDAAVLLTVSERSLLLAENGRAEVDYLGPGHTQGDLVLVLPERGILFSGDLAVNGVLPFLRSPDVDPLGWDKILGRLAGLKVEAMVPGHGAIGPREGIADTAAYLRRVIDIGQKIVLAGQPESVWEAQVRSPENVIENVRPTPDHIANVEAVAKFLKAKRETAGAATPGAGGEASKPAATPAPTPRP